MSPDAPEVRDTYAYLLTLLNKRLANFYYSQGQIDEDKRKALLKKQAGERAVALEVTSYSDSIASAWKQEVS